MNPGVTSAFVVAHSEVIRYFVNLGVFFKEMKVMIDIFIRVMPPSFIIIFMAIHIEMFEL